jgi:lysophospholipase L1-like esterase
MDEPSTRPARRRQGLGAGVILSLIACAAGLRGQAPEPERWVGTWATALVASAIPTGGPSSAAQPQRGVMPPLAGRTLRQIVRVSLGGERVRIVFSNAFGQQPLVIGAAHVAPRRSGAELAAAGHALSFSGSPSARIPPGAVLVSDAVSLRIDPLSDLAVDLYLPEGSAASPAAMHGGARQTSFLSGPGNHAGALSIAESTAITAWYYLARLEVAPATGVGAVVTIGDSITDGYNSTPDTNNRWPDHLAARLAASGASAAMGVLNLGIGGNRLLADGMGASVLARFDRDVLAQTGATHLIVLAGINDLGLAREGPRPTASDLIGAHRQLIARARSRGLKAIGGTLLPYEGTTIPNYFSEDGETARRAFNEWMRASGEYDGIVDFDRALGDPARPARLLEAYDSGDRLHPNDAGYRSMANAVDLALLRTAVARAAWRFTRGEPADAWALFVAPADR